MENNICKKCGKTSPEIKNGICFDCFLKSIPIPNDNKTDKKQKKSFINSIKNLKNKKCFKPIAIVIVVSFSLLVFLSTLNYIKAPTIAKNATAIDLSEGNNNFLSINKAYTTVEIYGLQYIVEVSGSAKVKINDVKTKEEPFTATVWINSITGKTFVSSNIKLN